MKTIKIIKKFYFDNDIYSGFISQYNDNNVKIHLFSDKNGNIFKTFKHISKKSADIYYKKCFNAISAADFRIYYTMNDYIFQD